MKSLDEKAPLKIEPLYTVKEVADYLRVSARVVYELVERGRLQCHRVGAGSRGVIRITVKQVERYLKG